MATLKPTKATRAAAPDLFGQPAYYNDAHHHQGLIEQLKGLGLMPAAWALEDLLEKANKAEELAERVELLEDDLDTTGKQLDATQSERDDLRSFFESVVRAFEESPGAGYWPAAEPDDDNLIQAIADTLANSTGPDPS